jgi:hypothetical protein
VIKFVSDLRHVGGFLPGTPVSSTNNTDRHDIIEILLKVALNTITLNLLRDWCIYLNLFLDYYYHSHIDHRKILLLITAEIDMK